VGEPIEREQLMELILVTNSDSSKKWKDRYKLFRDWESAFEHAKSIGYESLLPVDKRVGMLNFSSAEIDIGIIALEIE
jgi:hypothetical protein